MRNQYASVRLLMKINPVQDQCFKRSEDSEPISYRWHMMSQNRRIKLELHAKNEKTPSKSYQIYLHGT